mmetsp:Transcript_20803/g.58608  ORF Transcript_20803/g.58608 Transcript_20803/m.58608 type:complete len:285 (-) Transcript_20803:105-959(-)
MELLHLLLPQLSWNLAVAHSFNHLESSVRKLAGVKPGAVWVHLVVCRSSNDLDRACDVLEPVGHRPSLYIRVHEEAFVATGTATTAGVHAAAHPRHTPWPCISVDVGNGSSVRDRLVHLFTLRKARSIVGIAAVQLYRCDPLWLLVCNAQGDRPSTAVCRNRKLSCTNVVHDREDVDALIVVGHLFVPFVERRAIVAWSGQAHNLERQLVKYFQFLSLGLPFHGLASQAERSHGRPKASRYHAVKHKKYRIVFPASAQETVFQLAARRAVHKARSSLLSLRCDL